MNRSARQAVQDARRWRPWFTIKFFGGPLDGGTRRTWRGGWVWLDDQGVPMQAKMGIDCYWLIHAVEEKRAYYEWDTDKEHTEPYLCPCCHPHDEPLRQLPPPGWRGPLA